MTKIGRIKGANSDYLYDPEAKQIVETDKADKDNPVELSVFVCPHRQPSRVDQHQGRYCVGTDDECPSGQASGHARLRLHQTEGANLQAQGSGVAVGKEVLLKTPNSSLEVGDDIQLQTQKSSLTVGQDIGLQTQKSSLTVGQDIALSPGEDGHIKLAGDLELPEQVFLQKAGAIAPAPAFTLTLAAPAASHQAAPMAQLQITLTGDRVTLSGPGQTRIVLDHSGNITLTPGSSGQVKIDGGLEVTGDLTLPQGNISSPQPQLTLNNAPLVPPPVADGAS